MRHSQAPRPTLRLVVLWLLPMLAAGFGHMAAGHAQSCTGPLPEAAYPPIQITPVTVQPQQSTLFAVPATDGKIHLAYAALAANVARGVTAIGSIVPVDALRNFAPAGYNAVVDTRDRPITGKIRLFAATTEGQQDYPSMPGGSAGMTFFDVTYDRLADLPQALAHQVTVTPPGSTDALVELTNPIRVSCAAPVVLSPPLAGYGWWDGNGCCETISPHRGATLAVNGDIKLPEQFAIDFVQLNARNECCTGPVKDLASWPFFGVPIYAAAGGTVVSLDNSQPEQVPGPPVGTTAATAAGNNIVEDIGNGRFVLYAHLKTGSIPAGIAKGSHLAVGEQIGQLGNSGNTTAPHLHFQVMDRPSALDSTGLPFVFDRQLVQGRVLGTAAATNEDYEAGKPVNMDQAGSGWQSDRMPLEGQVLGFHVP